MSDSGERDFWSNNSRGPSPGNSVTVEVPVANPRDSASESQGEPASSSAKSTGFLISSTPVQTIPGCLSTGKRFQSGSTENESPDH